MNFTSLLNEINEILEQELSRYDILKTTYATPKKKKSGKVIPPKIPEDILVKLIVADPTTRHDGDDGQIERGESDIIKKVGKYAQWIIKQWMGLQQKAQEEFDYDPNKNSPFQQKLSALQELFLEDLYKTTEDLIKFDRFKNQIDQSKRDINNITSVDELYELTKDFSLIKATTSKAERKKSDVHPGAELVYNGDKFNVFMIEDQGALGKEAACFYGGQNKETRWCTSAPGLSYFDRYIKDGPLYVIIDKTDTNIGELSKLPKHRYQFHFPSNQYMDIDDRQIDLAKYLGPGGILNDVSQFFKGEFAKFLTKDFSDTVKVSYPSDALSKFIAIYGFDEFLEKLPQSLKRFDFEVKSSNDLPPQSLTQRILSFPELETLHVEGILSELPEDIDRLSKLQFISIPNNPNLKSIPDSLANLEDLSVLNIRGYDGEIGPKLQEKVDSGELILIM